MNLKVYFRDFNRKRHQRNVLEIMVFILYLTSSLQNVYARAWRLAFLIEYLKQKWEQIKRQLKINYKTTNIQKLTQTPGFKVAYRVNIYLSLLTRLGQSFPINTQKKIWKNPTEKNFGVVFISVHLPLVKVAIARLIADGQEIDAGLSASITPDMKMSFWGITQKVPIIQTGALSLVKIKSILQQKGSVVMMADTGPLSDIYPNIFHLAAKTNADVFFLLAYLNDRGVVEIFLEEPPHKKNSSEEQIKENMNALKVARDSILVKYSRLM